MKTDRLYTLKKEDLPKAIRTLTESFAADPLYRQLIPEAKLRRRLLPELFECDTEEMFESCDIFADSPEVNGLIIVDDETEDYNPLAYYSLEAFYALKTDACLIRDDLSLKTLWNFFLGRQYLNSRWTEELSDNRLHIIYFAVRPASQGSGIAHKLITPVMEYADRKDLLLSLETHNAKNLPRYQHYGFKVYKTLQSHFSLTQYCLVREPGGGRLRRLFGIKPAQSQAGMDLMQS
ncbi:MAG: GNAT family N-acetyltransferase [Peptococcaceae bacterium]|nr:GNAT family N-acetyltransferase [Peptococcaceae bacterium]